MDRPPHVFTIGHSTHPIEQFLGLLERHGVTAIADVRSVPGSRWQPQFGREPLAHALSSRGISYVFLGRELGARPDDSNCYMDGRVSYARLAASAPFEQGIKRIVDGSQRKVIALMCSEAEPLDCHRTILIARELVDGRVDVDHLLRDGKIESHPDAIRRLLRQQKLLQGEFFRSTEEVIVSAYARQEERIAYVDEELVATESQRTS